MVEELTEKLASGGAVLVGFADLRGLPAELRDQMPFGVSFAVALDGGVIAGIAGGPTEAYGREYHRANAVIDALAVEAAAFLRQCGHRAVARTATAQQLDPDLKPIELPHKTVATLAGLGWVGSNALLITEAYGPAVRLGTVLTDAPLPTAVPVTESRCGECSACVDACPAGALTGVRWRQGTERADLVDVRACREALRRYGRDVGADVCGICIAACPWTAKYLRRGPGT